MHFSNGIFSNKSEQIGKVFFNSPLGDSNPQAELEETIRAFFSSAEFRVEIANQHPYCLFPARRKWLEEKLSINFPAQPCPEYDVFMDDIRPASAQMIFPGPYVSAPASMFGHTLINIKRYENTKAFEEQNKNRLMPNLLSYAVNYGALVDMETANPITYSILGVFGGYSAAYAILPYYIKVREYSDIDVRDIWEYDLKLTHDELIRMTDHIWELQYASYDYYFFRENCSYSLLTLLEVARPGTSLRKNFGLWTIPMDTIKLLIKEGFLSEPEYRPSRYSKLRERLEKLDKIEYSKLNKAFDDPIAIAEDPELDNESKVRILDIALDRSYIEEIQDNDRKEILKARSKISIFSDELTSKRFTTPPEKSHKISKATVGYGYNSELGSQAKIRYRASALDYYDDPLGYEADTTIEFFHLAANVYADQARLQYLKFIQVGSNPKYEVVRKSISWDFSTGLGESQFLNNHGIYWRNEGKLGFAFFPNASKVSILSLVRLDIGNGLNSEKDNSTQLSLGVAGRFFSNFIPYTRIGLELRGFWDAFAQRTITESEFVFSFSPYLSHEYRLEATSMDDFYETSINFSYYF